MNRYRYFCMIMSCITLLSDIGLQDATIASAKGLFMQQLPGIPIVDIAHNVEPFHTQQAAYLLAAAYPDFPYNTYHIILFDVFYNKDATMVLAEKDGSYMLAPDNGILPLAFQNSLESVRKCYAIKSEDTIKTWILNAADAIKQIAEKGLANTDYQPYSLKNAPSQLSAKISADTIECQVIHIDRFENVILNITKQQFEQERNGREFLIRFMRDDKIEQLSDHYFDVEEGKKLCRFNSAGYLEIAINKGKAASLFGFRLIQERQLMYNTIKIEFL